MMKFARDTRVDTSPMPIFTLLSQRMSWLSARQSVLAQNVANSDTPGYAARDMKPMDFDAMLAQANGGGTQLAVTNVRHINANGATGSSTGADMQSEDASEESTPTGNSVSLEEEMIKLSDTQVQYQAVTNLYAKAMGMFRTALGSR